MNRIAAALPDLAAAAALAQEPAGTSNERVIKNLSEKLNLGIRILNVKDHGEGFLVLESGRVDANVRDDVQLHGLRNLARNPSEYAVVGRQLS